jgi:multiple sugar transport system substrate-binding protein
MTLKLDRRQFLASGAAAAAYLGTAGLGRADAIKLRMAWWGGQVRVQLTTKALQLYTKEHPGTTIDTEYLGWDDYWPRLSTETAGGNSPDVLQMDIEYLAEYASRGVLVDLGPYIPSALQVSDFDKAVIDNGKVNGKLYAISAGVNAVAILYDKTAYEEAGVTPPGHSTTWDELAQNAAEFTKKTKHAGMFGATDESGAEPVLETWLRQRGKQLYDTDGKLAYDADDVADWFKMWADMRASAAVPPADVTALDHNNVDTSLIAQGRAALTFENSNEYVAYSGLIKGEMGMAPYPKVGPDGKGGLYIKPSQFFSVSSQSKLPDASVALINFLLTDPGATAILSTERGIPSSAAVRDKLRPTLDKADKLMLDYISNLGDLAGPLPPPNPPGGGEVTTALLKASQEVAFGAKSPADSAASYIATAKEILSRAG